MNNILNSIKLDYYILKSSNLRRLGIVALVPLIAGFLGKNPPLMLGLTMMLSAFFMSTIFATAEKSHLNKLYGILPVEKHQTVIGRYVLTFLVGAVIAVIASIVALGAAFILKVEFSEFNAWFSGSFLVFCFIISAQFPLYFKYDFSKLAAFANLPYALIILAGSYLIKKYPQTFGQIVTFFIHNPYMIWVTGIGGAIILLCASALISIGLYKNREL